MVLQEQQLGSMENEVRNMQMELVNVQRERQQLDQQRKLLKCTGPCAPCNCCPPSMPTCMAAAPVPCKGAAQVSADNLHSKLSFNIWSSTLYNL